MRRPGHFVVKARSALAALKASLQLGRLGGGLGRLLGGVLHGRLTTTLADGSLEARAGATFDAARSHVMLCGNPAMIQEMTALLEGRGLRKHRQRKPGHISIEKYW